MKRRIDRVETDGIRAYVLDEERKRFGGAKTYGKWFVEEFAKSRTDVVKAAMQAGNSIDYHERLSEIKCPVLFLLGELFVNQEDPDGKILALAREKLPKYSEVMVIKRAPWFVVYTKPEQCAKLSMKFFEKKDE
ncbi:alpha/beta fold hydrolase [Chloroflexota bacterium]